MLAHRNIKILFNADYREVQKIIPHREVIYTGPVDEYFDFRYGHLPYRSLEFKFETLNTERHQPVAVINYPNENLLHARHRIQISHRAGAPEDVAGLRVSPGVWRSVLSDSTKREQRALSEVSDAGGRYRGRPFRGTAGDLQVLQHGSGGRSGADVVFEAAAAKPGGMRSRMAHDVHSCAAARVRLVLDGGLRSLDSHQRRQANVSTCWRRLSTIGRSIMTTRCSASIGIRTVRDAVRWHLVERDGRFDFSSLAPMVAAAEKHGTQVMWTLLHYGVPEDVDMFSPDFPARFARYSSEVAKFIRTRIETAAAVHAHQRDFVLHLGGWRRGMVLAVRARARPGAEAATGQSRDCRM